MQPSEKLCERYMEPTCTIFTASYESKMISDKKLEKGLFLYWPH